MQLKKEDLNQLKNLKSKSLFYPCAGRDIIEVLDLFAPYINEFHFVDLLDEEIYGHNRNLRRPFLEKLTRRNHFEDEENFPTRTYNFIDLDMVKLYRKLTRERYSSGPDKPYRGQISFTPFHEKETYSTADQFKFDLYKYRDDGYCVFKKLIDHIDLYDDSNSDIYSHDDYRYYRNYRESDSVEQKKFAVFFYRGDSQGEGGSGFYWLSNKYLSEVLQSIEDGGFLVTDGSNFSDIWDIGSKDINFDSVIKKKETVTFERYTLTPIGFLRDRVHHNPHTMVFQKSSM